MCFGMGVILPGFQGLASHLNDLPEERKDNE
jgi:hypothetical protein